MLRVLVLNCGAAKGGCNCSHLLALGTFLLQNKPDITHYGKFVPGNHGDVMADKRCGLGGVSPNCEVKPAEFPVTALTSQ